MDTSLLTTAYQALRDYLSSQDLYGGGNTPGFDREHLAELFTAYYDAEAAVLGKVSAAGASTAGDAVLEEVATKLGYENAAALRESTALGQTLIDGGYLRATLIQTKGLVAEKILAANATTGDTVSIDPENGLRLLKKQSNGTDLVTAEFKGDSLPNIEAAVPSHEPIFITEKTGRVTAWGPQLIQMALGTVSAAPDRPLTATIPALRLTSTIALSNSTESPPMAKTDWLRLMVYVSVKDGITGQTRILGAALCPTAGTHLDEISTDSGKSIVADIPAYDVNFNSTRELDVLLTAVVTASADVVLGSFRIQYSARFLGNTSREMMSWPIIPGGGIFNAVFYGNGMVFSRSSKQHVGMCTNDNGTELQFRSGDYGVRMTGAGEYRLDSQGFWQRSAVVMQSYKSVDRAYRIWSDGFIEQFIYYRTTGVATGTVSFPTAFKTTYYIATAHCMGSFRHLQLTRSGTGYLNWTQMNVSNGAQIATANDYSIYLAGY